MLRRLLLLSAAFLLGTVVFGWWSVPAIAAAWGVLMRGAGGAAVQAASASMLAWAVLLVMNALTGRLVDLLMRLAPLFAVPAIVLPVVALLLAGALAWSAAATAGALFPRRE